MSESGRGQSDKASWGASQSSTLARPCHAQGAYARQGRRKRFRRQKSKSAGEGGHFPPNSAITSSLARLDRHARTPWLEFESTSTRAESRDRVRVSRSAVWLHAPWTIWTPGPMVRATCTCRRGTRRLPRALLSLATVARRTSLSSSPPAGEHPRRRYRPHWRAALAHGSPPPAV